MYKLELKVNGKVYKQEGKTALSALKKYKFDGFKTIGLLRVRRGEKKYQFLLPVFRLKRIFINDNTKMVMAKNIETMLR